MKQLPWLLYLCFLHSIPIFAQSNKATNDAFLVYRMAEKFHFQPRPLNDEFSSNIFSLLINQLDEQKIFFTSADIAALAKYKFEIDDQVKNRRGEFLSLLTKTIEGRLTKADTMVENILKAPINFSLPEKISVLEDSTFPANDKEARIKLAKILKYEVLEKIMDDERILNLKDVSQKKYLDSVLPLARKKVLSMFKHSINIMLRGAGGIKQKIGEEYCKAIALCYDPHTEYFATTEKENFESQLGQQAMVFGFSLNEEDDGTITIKDLEPGSPAFKSGQFNKGDKMLSVQWENQQPIDVTAAGIRELSQVLSMSNHDKATIRIRKADGSERSVVLWKAQLEDDDDENKVKSFLLKGNKTIGFISLPAFYQDWEDEEQGSQGCANDVAREILKLKKENIQGLILDLRYNGGGSMHEAIQLAGIFIDAGPVGQYKDRGAKVVTLKDINRGTIYDGPLMLLVNGYSASASEMLAGTLQDYNRAVITGTPTYGKATAQVVLPMDTTINLDKPAHNEKAESYIKLTVSQLYRVNGTTAQAKGVQPDILLPELPGGNSSREADNKYVLLSAPIDGNKYFKPMPAMNISVLKTTAATVINASSVFSFAKKYLAFQNNFSNARDISLKLSDAIEEEKKLNVSEADSAVFTKDKPPYEVNYHTFELQQIKLSIKLKEMNEQWVQFLNRDPYLHVAYTVMLQMIK